MKRELVEKFGKRVSFDRIERRLYSHDIADLPSAVEKLIHNMPEAVVQPVDVEEVVYLANFARRHGLPLVPRGSATSGYGGAVPARGGIVVDFSRMKHVVTVDAAANSVTVQPGVVWKNLGEALKPHGLALRLYPTSALGSTVAGWVAEGGAGIGSFEYGPIGENVESVKVVTPSGEVKTFSGEDLGLINGAEGTTGFIVEITLKVRDDAPDVPVLAAFPDLTRLSQAIAVAKDKDLPLWHVGFFTSDLIRRKLQAEKESQTLKVTGNGHGHGGGNGHGPSDLLETLPLGKDLALFVYPKFRQDAVEKDLVAIIEAAGGEVLDQRLAEHEWAERYYPMRVKRLGPSLIPSEAIAPLASLDKIIAESSAKLEGLVVEGSMVSADQAALLGFILGDQRTLAYTLDFAKSLVALKIAQKHGGRPYSVGLYFTDKAARLLGREKLARLRAYKRREDPQALFNPGKIFADGKGASPALLRAAMRTAEAGQPLMALAERFVSRQPHVKRELAEKIAYESFACAQCGYCRDVCTLYKGRQWESASPRGKWYFLKEYLKGDLDLTQEMVDTFLLCTTCKRCDDVCQIKGAVQEMWDELRGVLVAEKGFQTFPAFEMMGATFDEQLNIWAGWKTDRAAWMPEDVTYEESGEIGYWAGCTASYLESDIAENAVHILKEGGVKFTYLAEDEACCGVPFLVSGKWDVWERAFRHNLAQIKKRGIKTMVISCPGCHVAFNHYYPQWAAKLGLEYDLEIKHITETTSELIRDGKLDFKKALDLKVTYHDPCHIGRHAGIYEPPREVIAGLPGVEFREMAHNRENGLCCGSVLTRVGEPATSDRIAAERLSEAKAVGADAVLTTCPCCEFQLRVGGKSTGLDVPVRDITSAVVEALGYEPKDPTVAVHWMWGVFESILQAMTVDGMVEMMTELMPDMMENMSGGMQRGIGMMKNMPGPVQSAMFGMMGRMMPKMMPRMMPSMMPKLMPRVLEIMKEKVPDMPPSMAEMMPELLPKVMAKIMPALLPEATPELTPKMLEYMRR